jgi:metallo-beta-lactamase class B
VSDETFRYSDSTRYRTAIVDFYWSFYIVRNLACDVLLTPHPDASNLWGRLAERDSGKRDALYDTGACRAYANKGRRAFEDRLARERQPRGE